MFHLGSLQTSLMAKRARIALAFLVVALVAVAIWLIRGRTFNGRSESYWIRSLTNAFNPTPFQPKPEWVSLGTNAVPILIRGLEQNEGPFQKTYRKVRPKLPAMVQKWTPEPLDYAAVHRNALVLLRPGTGVVPQRTVIPLAPIVALLRDPDWMVRENALAMIFAQMPRSQAEMEAILPQIITTTKDLNPLVRMNAMLALQYYTQETNTVLPILNAGLADLDADVRIRAAMALNKLDPSEQTQARIIPVALGCSQSKGPNGAAFTGTVMLHVLATNSPWLSIRRGATNAIEESELMKAAYR
jgi:hypothetical protein